VFLFPSAEKKRGKTNMGNKGDFWSYGRLLPWNRSLREGGNSKTPFTKKMGFLESIHGGKG